MKKKKRGSLLRVRPEAPFSVHTVIYHQKRLLPRKLDERLMGFPTGLLGPCWAAWILEITVMGGVRGGFSHLGIEEFSHIINSAVDSIAPWKRGFTAISPRFLVRTGKRGQ